MANKTVKVGDIAQSVSVTHRFNCDKVIFLNTSDILMGKVLNRAFSTVKGLPGQAKKTIQRNDILFSEIRPANGRWAYVDFDAEDYVVSTKLMVIRCISTDIVPRFLYHYLTSASVAGWLQHLAESRSGTFPQITFDQVADLDLVLLPKSEQEQVCSLLDAIESKIGLNRQMNETLEAMARALFKSWFVDFDPVRAKSQGRDPSLPRDIADLFPDSFEGSELGEIPKGWVVGSISDFATLNPSSWSNQTRPEIIDYVDLSNTKWGRIEATTIYDRDEAPSRAQRALQPGDTIVGTVRPGNGSYALVSRTGLTGSTGFAVLRPKAADYMEYVYLAVTRKESIEALSHLADGGAYPAVRPEVVVTIRALMPGERILQVFSELTSAMLSRMSHSDSENAVLAQKRDLLLPKLISGELRVPDLDVNG